MQLDAKIEAILFFRAEPTTPQRLAKILGVKEREIRDSLKVLGEKLQNRGLRLVEKDDAFMLGTAPEVSDAVEAIQKEELQKDLGKAGLETLTTILYRAPISKADIDYIRGVNSSFILRNLLIRGLVERETNPEDRRTFLYFPSFDLFSHLGITKMEELPEYEEVQREIQQFKEEFGGCENLLDLLSHTSRIIHNPKEV